MITSRIAVVVFLIAGVASSLLQRSDEGGNDQGFANTHGWNNFGGEIKFVAGKGGPGSGGTPGAYGGSAGFDQGPAFGAANPGGFLASQGGSKGGQSDADGK